MKTLLLLAALLALAGCVPSGRQTVKIVAVHPPAFAGQGYGHTVIQLPNGKRLVLDGQYGAVGEEFIWP